MSIKKILQENTVADRLNVLCAQKKNQCYFLECAFYEKKFLSFQAVKSQI